MSHPTLLVALPLLAAFLLPIAYRSAPRVGQVIGPATLLLTLLFGGLLWLGVKEAGPQVVTLSGFAAPIGIVFYVDGLAALFAVLMVVSALWLWPKGELDRAREDGLTLLLVAGGCGLALSGDLFNLYVFYELIAVASYGLAASRGEGAGYGAALRLLVLGALGSALALLGIALVYGATGTLNLAQLATLAPHALSGPLGLAAFALIMVGFGVKAELFPVNTWVPEVYAAAPARTSGLLAGIVSKLALLVLLRLLVLVFHDTAATHLLLTVGILGLVSGELAAFRAGGLRHVLAYSSVAQLGLVAIAFAVPGPAGVAAGLAVALHHLLVKPALFLMSDAWGGPVGRLQGAAQVSPTAAVVFVILALSLVGVPPLPGFWAKFLVLQALVETGAAAYQLALVLVLAATVVEAAYLFRIVRLLYQRETPLAPGVPAEDLAPAMALGSAVVIAAFLAGPLWIGLSAIAAQAVDAAGYVERTLSVSGALGGRAL